MNFENAEDFMSLLIHDVPQRKELDTKSYLQLYYLSAFSNHKSLPSVYKCSKNHNTIFTCVVFPQHQQCFCKSTYVLDYDQYQYCSSHKDSINFMKSLLLHFVTASHV